MNSNNPSNFISDGMGGVVQDLSDLLEVIVEPGATTAPFQDLDPADVAKALAAVKVRDGIDMRAGMPWVGEGRLGMSTLGDHMKVIRGASEEPTLGLSIKDFSTHLMVFGKTNTGMTSSSMRSTARDFLKRGKKQKRGKKTRR